MRSFYLYLLLLAVCVVAACAPEAVSVPTPSPVVQIDLAYCTVDGVPLRMDVYAAAPASASPAPLVIYIHGGGWTGGDKSDGVGTWFIPALQRQGFVVAAINYRLAPSFTFPAPIADVKCAVRHLRAQADAYGIDPQRIGVLGGSAGGHLAALLGLSDASAGWDVGQYLDHSSRVQAVVTLFAPADLRLMSGEDANRTLPRVFGPSALNDLALQALFSPVSYASPDDPPFLLLHGALDQTVPLAQSQALLASLQAAQVPAELVVVQHAGHSFQAVDGDIAPDLTEISRQVVAFFERVLIK